PLRGLSPNDVVQKLVLSKQALDRRPRQRCGVDGDVDLGLHFAFFTFAHFARAALRASSLRASPVVAAYLPPTAGSGPSAHAAHADGGGVLALRHPADCIRAG